MKIFKWVIDNFRKLALRLRKIRQEYIIRSRVRESRNTSQSDTEEKIRQLIASPDPIQEADVIEIINQQTALVLGLSEGDAVGNPPLSKRKFDLVEVEQELNKLHLKLFEIGLKESRVDPVYFPQSYPIDKRIEGLEHFFQVHDGKKNLSFEPSAVEKLKSQFRNFDRFLQERVLVKIYRAREDRRRQEEEVKKQQVKELIGRIENLINHGDLQQVKNQIVKATSSISALRNPDQKKFFREKLEILKAKFRERLIREEAKRQAEELRKRQEEAERRRIAEDAKREEERKQRERLAQIQKQQEDVIKRKEEEKKQELQRLIVKKTDWQDFAYVLQVNGITTLYHFTDRANIKSIKENGGLYSWYYCDRNNITILKPGGSMKSRELDRKYHLHDYVRLSFAKNHPMMFIARDDERNLNPIVLEVGIEPCFWIETKFSDMNAAKTGHKSGKEMVDLSRVHFQTVKQPNHFGLDDAERPYYQAEILVKTWIPIEYITNINQF